MSSNRKHFDRPSILVIVITFVLFVCALLTRGLTHDLFPETALFLVSLKLIVASYRNSVVNSDTKARLEAIATSVQRVENKLALQRERQEQHETLELERVM